MEDAYTVGIRLALDDGVSAGIAVINGELAALDRAIAGTTMGLERLRMFGGSAGVSAATDLQHVARQGGQVMQLSVPPPEVTAPAASVRTDATAVTSQAAAMPLAVTPPPTAPVIRILSPLPLPLPAASQLPMALPPPTAPPLPDFTAFAPSPSAIARTDARPLATTAPPAVQVIEHRSQPLLCEIERSAAPSPASLPSEPLSMASAASLPAVAPTIPVPVPRAAAVSPASAAPPAMTAAFVRSTGATVPASGTSFTAGPSGVANKQRERQSPLPEQATAGHSQGDVFLDGARVGRWMADTLTREAARPSAGSTPFDPRMGPSWPGAQQGF